MARKSKPRKTRLWRFAYRSIRLRCRYCGRQLTVDGTSQRAAQMDNLHATVRERDELPGQLEFRPVEGDR